VTLSASVASAAGVDGIAGIVRSPAVVVEEGILATLLVRLNLSAGTAEEAAEYRD